MATSNVRFEFMCEKGKLNFTHDVPRSLIGINPQQSQGAAYMKTFIDTIQPILLEHEPACRESSSPQCGECGSPTAKILLSPMTWLHIVENPFVNVWANPVCDKATCEAVSRQKIQDLMTLITNNSPAQSQPQGTVGMNTQVDLDTCRVCAKKENTSRCGRCKAVAYCGKEHQVADWGLHKKVCKSTALKST